MRLFCVILQKPAYDQWFITPVQRLPIVLFQKRMKGNRISPPEVGLSPELIPLKLLLNHSWFRKSRNGSTKEQYWDIVFAFLDSRSGHTGLFVLHENILLTRGVILSMGELGTMSDNNLRGITLRKGLDMGSTPLLINLSCLLTTSTSQDYWVRAWVNAFWNVDTLDQKYQLANFELF